MEFTYSVIIPHYNIPDLLIRCLDSVPVREDIQVIVVDDCTPGGEDLPERYPQLKRPYLEFFRAPRNGGAGWSRNLALPRAQGTWLVFGDADDCFAEGAFDAMDRYAGSDADIVFFRTGQKVEGDWKPGPHYEWLYNAYKKAVETGNDGHLRAGHIPPWGKMLRRSFVENLGVLFDETRYSDDVLFSIRTGAAARKVIVAPELIYYAYLRQGSQTNPEIWTLPVIYDWAEKAILANGLYRKHFNCYFGDAYESLAVLFRRDFGAFCRLLPLAVRNKVSLRRLFRRAWNSPLKAQGWQNESE